MMTEFKFLGELSLYVNVTFECSVEVLKQVVTFKKH